MKIDAHQHFWQYNALKHSWISDEMYRIRRDFMPTDLEPILKNTGFDACVLVQVEQNLDENRFFLNLAEKHNFIRGVVGWVDLCSENVQEELSEFSQHKKFKGVRHIVQGERDVHFMLRPKFQHGISQLERFNLTYDILVFPKQLKAAIKLVRQFPNQAFVLDHIAKPYIKKGLIKTWAKQIKTLAKSPNITCKISGMVTEANFHHWTKADIRPYLDVIVENFGIDRLMFGSDWPVCLVAAEYEQVVRLVEHYFAFFSTTEKEKIFGGNAVAFYHL